MFARTDYFGKILRIANLGLYFVWELVVSSLQVVWDVLTPMHRSSPAIIAVPLDIDDPDADHGLGEPRVADAGHAQPGRKPRPSHALCPRDVRRRSGGDAPQDQGGLRAPGPGGFAMIGFGEHPQVVGWAINLTAALIVLGLAFAFARLVRGPTLPDRVMSVDMITVLAVALAGLLAVASGKRAFIDVAIALALVAFLTTVAFAWYGGPADGAVQERPELEERGGALVAGFAQLGGLGRRRDAGRRRLVPVRRRARHLPDAGRNDPHACGDQGGHAGRGLDLRRRRGVLPGHGERLAGRAGQSCSYS